MAEMWIANRPTGALDGRVFEVLNPATEEVIDEAPRAGSADVDRAVAAAKGAFPEWRRTPGIERAEKLHHVARRIRDDREGLAVLLTKEGGKPLPENRDEIEWIAACFDYYAEIGRDVVGRVISPVARNQFNFVVKEPYGVCGLIVPWNYPLLLLTWKLAPALAAGNAVVAKPSEHTPLSTLRLMRAFEDLPEGVVNVVTGYGPEAGMSLVQNREVEVVAFTGSQATGRKVAVACAEQLKKCHLELGGNDPFIVDEGVDLDVAAKGAAWACFLNMGQVCTSAERFYVVGKVFDEFVDTMNGSLPPSSRWHFLSCWAQVAATRRPVAWLPVKATTSTSRLATRGAPASSPKPVTMLRAPSGKSSKARMSRRVESGVHSLGLATTVLPAARAGASIQDRSRSG